MIKITNEIYKENKKLAKIRRIIITPSGAIYSLKEFELTNRVIRMNYER
jgi:hypothetical protein